MHEVTKDKFHWSQYSLDCESLQCKIVTECKKITVIPQKEYKGTKTCKGKTIDILTAHCQLSAAVKQNSISVKTSKQEDYR